MLAFDCSGSGYDICKEQKVKSYPTIKYFTDDDFEDYEGGSEENDFIKFLSENTEDAEIVDDNDADEAKEDKADAKTAEPKVKEKVKSAEKEEGEEQEVDMKKDEL